MAEHKHLSPSQSRVRVWSSKDLDRARFLRGDYIGHIYPWHSHEELLIGVVSAGALSLETRDRSAVARAGSIAIVNSEEVYRGAALGGRRWLFRTIHLHPDTILRVATNLRPNSSRNVLPRFRSPVVQDAFLANELTALHVRSEARGDPLDLQSRAVTLIARMLLHHWKGEPELPEAGEPMAVRLARDILTEDLGKKISLEKLARLVGLPPFRILRAFEKATGLTPHAYRTQARIRKAYNLICHDHPIAEVAAATGFADQAHLTRVFKSIMGATPGQFRAVDAPAPSLPTG
ncbi:helix-turn-helix transcriptional regulator [Oryzifoliimicrobium ureilyticus]|uniref:helix-turn-helix transcriptional regulator n=1 Tax=Oryzifoliimicrobium ureilyticus TaxID=3113724 RepID=UPI0030764844